MSASPVLRPHVLIFTIALAACGGGGADDGGGAAGSGSLDGPDRAIDPQTEDVFTVGALEGEVWETFGTIAGVAFDPQGNLYVLDRDAAHIVKFSPTGEFVRTIGRKGDGPGELSGPMGLSILPDGRIVVFDIAKQAFEVFDANGDFDESVSRNPEEGFPGRVLLPTPDGRLATHGVMRISFGDGDASIEEPEGRPIELFGLDGASEVAYTAWEPPAPEGEESSELGSGNRRMVIRMQQTVAFEPQVQLGVLSDGRLAVVDSIGYRVKLVEGGMASETLERPIAPTVVDEGIMEMERQRRLDALEDGGGGSGRMIVIGGNASAGSGGGGMSVGRDQINEMMRGQIENMAFADAIPVIADLKVDWDDRIWIERSGARPGEDGPTDIVTPGGTYLGTIAPDGLRIPDAFGPDGLIAHIEADELEVQRVRVARLAGDEALESGRR